VSAVGSVRNEDSNSTCIVILRYQLNGEPA